MLVLLKANAYGHSAIALGKKINSIKLSKTQFYGFGVASFEEAVELREAGVLGNILVLSGLFTYNKNIDNLLRKYSLVPVVYSLEVLKKINQSSLRNKKTVSFHLKLNTGMNRLGISKEQLKEAVSIIKNNRYLKVTGMMSHLSASEKKHSNITKKQIQLFQHFVQFFKDEGINPEYVHIENSHGLKNNLFHQGNLKRVGLHLYGLGTGTKMKPVGHWYSTIFSTYKIKRGETVGYGPSFKAKRNMKIAILGVGYADGYKRSFSNKAFVVVKGTACPVIGTISMDLTAIDVSMVKRVSVGDKAWLIGGPYKKYMSADRLAEISDTIPWEVLTSISSRVPRKFIHD
ncbi:MAG: alanine racemase [Oligoflexia bacterium]|nr:alanine racemase [Oligoflexia bacterium]